MEPGRGGRRLREDAERAGDRRRMRPLEKLVAEELGEEVKGWRAGRALFSLRFANVQLVGSWRRRTVMNSMRFSNVKITNNC